MIGIDFVCLFLIKLERSVVRLVGRCNNRFLSGSFPYRLLPTWSLSLVVSTVSMWFVILLRI